MPQEREGPWLREGVIIYADLRGFTKIVETNVDVRDHGSDYISKLLSLIRRKLYPIFRKVDLNKPLGDGALFFIPWTSRRKIGLNDLVLRVAGEIKPLVDMMPEFASEFAKKCAMDDVFPKKLAFGITYGPCTEFEHTMFKSPTDTDFFGTPLNLGARLVDLARPEGIVIDYSSELMGLRDLGFVYDLARVKSFEEARPIWRYLPMRPGQVPHSKSGDNRFMQQHWSSWGHIKLPLEPLVAPDHARSVDAFSVTPASWDSSKKKWLDYHELPSELKEIYLSLCTIAQKAGHWNGIFPRLVTRPTEDVSEPNGKRRIFLQLQPAWYFQHLLMGQSLDYDFDDLILRERYQNDSVKLGGFVGTCLMYLTDEGENRHRIVFVQRKSKLAVAARQTHVSVAEGMRFDIEGPERSDEDPCDTLARGIYEELLTMPMRDIEVASREDWQLLREKIRITQIFFDWENWQYLFVGHVIGGATHDQVEANVKARIAHTAQEHETLLQGPLWICYADKDGKSVLETDESTLLENSKRLLQFVKSDLGERRWSTHALACTLSFLKYNWLLHFGDDGLKRFSRFINDTFGLDEDICFTLGPREYPKTAERIIAESDVK